jgi:hypothetical protein
MKQTMTQRAVRFLAARIASWAAAMRKLRVRLEESIPVGYEDETGFHTGDPDQKFHF